jgi:chromosome segregation ATPase
LDDDDDDFDDFDDEKETSSPRMSPREKNNASPSRLRKRLRGILDDNFASENFRRGGLEKIASVLEDNARLRSEKSALERDLRLYKKKDKENEREIRALRAISEDDERYSRMEKRLRLFEKHFGRVVEKLSARDEEERRNALMRTMLQRWKASAKARRMGKRENTTTSTGSNGVVVSRGRDLEKIEQLEDENADHLEKIEQLEDENADHLEKIEQLEDENADLRGALYTVKKKLRRTRLIFLQYDRLLAGGTIESDSDSDYSDSEY